MHKRLREAAERGDVAAVEGVLAKNPSLVDTSCGRTGWTALHASADRGRVDVLRYLLGMRADPGLRTARGATALALAGAAGHVECVKALLDVGADPAQAAGHSARTALHSAMRFDRPEVVRALVASGADPDRPSVSGVTARELGGFEGGERYTWQAHTATKILGDPFYLSANETAEQYPPLEDLLHSSVYAAEAKRWATESARQREAPPVVGGPESGGDSDAAAVPTVHEDAETDPQTAALAAALAAEAEVTKVKAEQEQAVAAAAQKTAKEAAEANAARLLAAVEQQRVAERREVERQRTAEERKRQARFDRLKAESASRASELLDLFEPEVQPRMSHMEQLRNAAEVTAVQREFSAAMGVSESTAAAAAAAGGTQQQQQQPGTAAYPGGSSTPREPPPPETTAGPQTPPIGLGSAGEEALGQSDDSSIAATGLAMGNLSNAPPVLFPSTSTAAQQQALPAQLASGPTVSIVLVKGDRVTLAPGAPAIFNLKPGRCVWRATRAASAVRPCR